MCNMEVQEKLAQTFEQFVEFENELIQSKLVKEGYSLADLYLKRVKITVEVQRFGDIQNKTIKVKFSGVEKILLKYSVKFEDNKIRLIIKQD